MRPPLSCPHSPARLSDEMLSPRLLDTTSLHISFDTTTHGRFTKVRHMAAENVINTFSISKYNNVLSDAKTHFLCVDHPFFSASNSRAIIVRVTAPSHIDMLDSLRLHIAERPGNIDDF
jgi:hypothetical protein